MFGRKPNWFIGFPIQDNSWCPVSIKSVPDSISLYHKDDLHVTLAFLGPVSVRKAQKAWKRALSLDLTELTISFNQIKPFGSLSTPSAYGLTLENGREEAIKCISRHQKPVLSAAGRKPREGRVVPHVTIARPTRRLSKADVFSIAEWRRDFEIPNINFRIDKIGLYTRASQGDHQRFKLVETHPLR